MQTERDADPGFPNGNHSGKDIGEDLFLSVTWFVRPRYFLHSVMQTCPELIFQKLIDVAILVARIGSDPHQ